MKRGKEWPCEEVLLRRLRINVGLTCEEILICAALEANSRGWTPYEVLVEWVRTKQTNLSVREVLAM